MRKLLITAQIVAIAALATSPAYATPFCSPHAARADRVPLACKQSISQVSAGIVGQTYPRFAMTDANYTGHVGTSYPGGN